MSRGTKIFLVQAVIVGGVLVYFKVALPSIERSHAEARRAENELAIRSFFDSATVQVGGEGTGSARRLRRTPGAYEVEQELGAPNQSMTDFAGAQHLTWLGNKHKLTASFNKGRLYALTISDLSGEHGERVYESSAQWQKF